jgi:hypothetical protein
MAPAGIHTSTSITEATSEDTVSWALENSKGDNFQPQEEAGLIHPMYLSKDVHFTILAMEQAEIPILCNSLFIQLNIGRDHEEQ